MIRTIAAHPIAFTFMVALAAVLVGAAGFLWLLSWATDLAESRDDGY